ncbi:hypothetical protein BT69DRAFT_1350227 [Atractiella rhizophila]|nr:hypothetical protein BT69DRAFT_1350227 [Atractiella rhizophila]
MQSHQFGSTSAYGTPSATPSAPTPSPPASRASTTRIPDFRSFIFLDATIIAHAEKGRCSGILGPGQLCRAIAAAGDYCPLHGSEGETTQGERLKDYWAARRKREEAVRKAQETNLAEQEQARVRGEKVAEAREKLQKQRIIERRAWIENDRILRERVLVDRIQKIQAEKERARRTREPNPNGEPDNVMDDCPSAPHCSPPPPSKPRSSSTVPNFDPPLFKTREFEAPPPYEGNTHSSSKLNSDEMLQLMEEAMQQLRRDFASFREANTRKREDSSAYDPCSDRGMRTEPTQGGGKSSPNSQGRQPGMKCNPDPTEEESTSHPTAEPSKPPAFSTQPKTQPSSFPHVPSPPPPHPSTTQPPSSPTGQPKPPPKPSYSEAAAMARTTPEEPPRPAPAPLRKPPRPSLALQKEETFRSWLARYTLVLREPLVREGETTLRVQNVPWPIKKVYKSQKNVSLKDITVDSVTEFLQKVKRSMKEEEFKQFLKKLLLSFHEDKTKILMDTVSDAPLKDMKEALGIVTRVTIDFKSEGPKPPTLWF